MVNNIYTITIYIITMGILIIHGKLLYLSIYSDCYWTIFLLSLINLSSLILDLSGSILTNIRYKLLLL